MALEYLHFNIFGLALSDMATSSGSISQRLAGAYTGYFYKVSWDKDLKFIPDEWKMDFLLLKKLFNDDIIEKVKKERHNLRLSYPEISNDTVSVIWNGGAAVKSLHWKKAKKIAELISHLYFSLGLEIKDQLKAQR